MSTASRMEPMKKPNSKKHASHLERRYLSASQSGTFEIRKSADGKQRTIYGFAAKFNVLSLDLGGFREKLDPHCFDKCLASSPDIRCLFNHDTNQPPLGRTSSGTLRLSTNRIGLAYECDAADNQMTRDIVVSIERGDISQSSFGFICHSDKFEQTSNGDIVRTVLVADIFDVSPVNFGAYPDATSGVRAALRSAPESIRAKLKDELDLDDSDDDDDDSDADDDEDDESDEDRCNYRCAECRSAHPKTDWPDAAAPASDADTVNCAFRCASCRDAHNAVDDVRAAHLHLLSLRR